MPDIDGLGPKSSTSVPREWFFTLINTLDPDFFPACLKEIEETREAKVKKVEEKQIRIAEDMLAILKSSTMLRGKEPKHTDRSIAMLK